MSILSFLKEVARDKYHYWRFRSYANKLEKESRKEEKKRYGSDLARCILSLLLKD